MDSTKKGFTTIPRFPIAFDPAYVQPLPEGHRFPMLKYDLIPGQLLHEGTITEADIFSPSLCPDGIVLLTHEATYLEKLKDQTLSAREQRVIGFPQSEALTKRELMIAQGTIDGMLFAWHTGVAMNIAGGTHHAFADRGEGFCMLNDQAIAANYFLEQGCADKILIVDLDVHQGNGTAKLFEHEPRVFTFSMHGATNYPFRKEKSDLDIGLPDGTGDAAYLEILAEKIDFLLDKVNPGIVFFLAGVDVLSTDRYGKLALTIDGCRLRDEMVFTKLKERGIPCQVSMGGGYSEDIKIITEAHCNTFRAAAGIYQL